MQILDVKHSVHKPGDIAVFVSEDNLRGLADLVKDVKDIIPAVEAALTQRKVATIEPERTPALRVMDGWVTTGIGVEVTEMINGYRVCFIPYDETGIADVTRIEGIVLH